ncbi:Mitogen-activated protein kinase 1 [Camellia lanceoleosa]|uniref:Mitogen-activated protein kinase 1 n=1 Tax=Camellia lanceoleosa TaxID=1840588 RepID=A0ACC0J2I2_9ERIC|nr:Mitogen-activated protein kinase 1 [Camellia lanceoleosa]
MRTKTNFAPLKRSLHRPTGPQKSLNPLAVYRLLLSWANAELSSQGVAAKRQNSTSFRSAETKNNKCTTRQPVEEALAHPYLARLHDTADEPACLEPFAFDFEQALGEEQIKDMIYQEALALNP